MQTRKPFIHWDDMEDTLVVGRARIPFDLFMVTMLVQVVPFSFGVVLPFYYSPWWALLAVPTTLLVVIWATLMLYRLVRWFVMEWVYVLQP